MSATTPTQTVYLHPLTMVPEDDGVMVGRPDTGSYALFPEDGAELLRLLGAGSPLADAVSWYERRSGSLLDLDDFMVTIGELGFLRDGHDVRDGRDGNGVSAPARPVRWHRLGRATFSWPAMTLYGAMILAALVAMISDPALRPSYRNVFFTEDVSLIPIVLTPIGYAFIVTHEWCHMLAGRRLGLPSTLGIGRRLYFLVAETRLDSLLSVPRSKRYLPFLAGMLADMVIIAGLTLLVAGLRGLGAPAWCSGLCLAVAFVTLLRVIWQFQFYLETDLYYVVSTASRCSHLQAATRFYVKAQVRRLLRQPARQPDPDWSDRDLAAARWYAPLLVAGYGFALGSLAWAGIPTLIRLYTTAIRQLIGPATTPGSIADGLTLIILTSAQFVLLGYVTVRDRRAKRLAAPRRRAVRRQSAATRRWAISRRQNTSSRRQNTSSQGAS